MQGDSGMSSTSSSTCSVTEVAATTIQGTESFAHASRERSRQQDHGHRFSPREEGSSKEKHIARKHWRHYKHKSHEAPHQKRNLHKEQLLSNTEILNEISVLKHQILASQTSTQWNAEFRVMEHDTSAEKGRVLQNPDGEVRNSS